MEVQVHLGSTVIPQYPIRYLEKALDLSASVEGIAINARQYRTDAVIIGLDCEKAGTGPGGNAAWTGLSTSVGGGSTIRIEVKNMHAFAGEPAGADPAVNPTRTSQVVDRTYLTLVYQVIMKQGACDKLDCHCRT